MSDFSNELSDLKDAFKGVFSGVSGIARDLAVSAGDKAKALGRIAKLTMDLNTERGAVEQVYAEIGRLYYETYKQEPGDFFIQLFDQVKLTEANIEAMEAELSGLKSAASDACGFEAAVEECEAECAAEDDSIQVEITDESQDGQ